MATCQVSYGSYGVVKVLESNGNLTHITTDGEHDFWVRTEKLKHKELKEQKPCVIVDTAPAAWKDFVSYLNGVGYKLTVYSRLDGIEQAQAEYALWAGEELPDDSIRLYDNKPLAREWVLTFNLHGNITCPFPIEIMGITGKKPTQKPRGLFRSAHRVEVNFAAIVEQLVRAGLRVVTA